jgi:hypothetical protein
MADDLSRRLEALRVVQAEAAHGLNNALTVIVNTAALVQQIAENAYRDTGDQRWQAIPRDIADIRTAAAQCSEIARRLSATAGHAPPRS